MTMILKFDILVNVEYLSNKNVYEIRTCSILCKNVCLETWNKIMSLLGMSAMLIIHPDVFIPFHI